MSGDECPWDVVIPAGGAGRRMDGLDKPAAMVGGRTMLARVVLACAGAEKIAVIGASAAALRGTQQYSETVQAIPDSQPDGGPVAAVAAALPELTSPFTLLVAADQPFLRAQDLRRLRAQLWHSGNDTHPGDGPRQAPAELAAAVDADGSTQPLLACWRRSALQHAVEVLGDPAGCSLRHLMRQAMGPILPVQLPHRGAYSGWRDCDTPEQLHTARELADREPPDAGPQEDED